MFRMIIFPAVAWMFLQSCSSKYEKSPFPAGEVIAVRVASPQASLAQPSVELTGILATEQEARYGFKIGGVIDKIYITEGQFFRKGQLLASLLLTEISKQNEQANLGVEKATRDYERAKNLYSDSVATLEQVQNAETGVRVARKSAEIVAFNQQYARIYAPVDGFVTKRLASEGEIIGAGTPVILANETGAGSGWVLRVGASDRIWSHVQTGQPAQVYLDAFSDTSLTGVIGRKSLVADPYSGSFQVEIKFQPHKLPVALGMFGRAKLALPSHAAKGLTIPYSALVEANGMDAFVFVVNGNRVRKVPVRMLSFDNELVQLASGIQANEQVVISNTAFLNEQSIISITR